MMPSILVVDDDDDIRAPLVTILRANGYETLDAADGASALELARRHMPDLAILDIMMPWMNGYVLCDRLHELCPGLPIIFLSARGDVVDKTMGFRSGADDYVTKPFSSEELLMRVQAVLRRVTRSAREVCDAITLDDLELLPKQYLARVKGREVPLTAREFELLVYLAAYPGQVFSRDQIYEGVWGGAGGGDTGAVAVYVRKIREQIEADPKHPRHLLTVWGVGYKLV